MMKYAMSILILVVLGGCIAWEPVVGPQIFYVDPLVEKARPRVIVAPTNPLVRPLGCICYPFGLRQKIDNGPRIGRELGQIFWDHLVSVQLFGLMLYAETPWPGVSAACAYARANGIDLVAMGTITQLMLGGATGTTSMGLEFRIYEADSQMMIWSMAHAGRLEGSYDRDYIVARSTTRMPQAPEFLVLQDLAGDLAALLKQWTTDPAWHGKKM